MASENVRGLTQADILRTASGFTYNRKMPDWTVIVNRREFPARPLVLEAAGVPPNDSTNSHQAIAKLKELGFDTRYKGKSV
jgi:hypothetical protein